MMHTTDAMPAMLPPLMTCWRQPAACSSGVSLTPASQQFQRRDNGCMTARCLGLGSQPDSRRRQPPGASLPSEQRTAPWSRTAAAALACWHSSSLASLLGAAAQQDVLLALSSSPRIGGAEAAALDSAAISHQDVHRALRRARFGTSPGPDGLPLELYRRHADFLYPLLARLFSVMLAYGDMPFGFHDGILVVIQKAGDRSLPANYRPITLLNTDYRTFTRVLAGRLGTALSDVFDPYQAAFHPHRSISDSITTMQLLPRVLAHERQSALAVLCDFSQGL
jgi:Reverse transcriptase (RNA-dependent DNA polymerase)